MGKKWWHFLILLAGKEESTEATQAETKAEGEVEATESEKKPEGEDEGIEEDKKPEETSEEKKPEEGSEEKKPEDDGEEKKQEEASEEKKPEEGAADEKKPEEGAAEEKKAEEVEKKPEPTKKKFDRFAFAAKFGGALKPAGSDVQPPRYDEGLVCLPLKALADRPLEVVFHQSCGNKYYFRISKTLS